MSEPRAHTGGGPRAWSRPGRSARGVAMIGLLTAVACDVSRPIRLGDDANLPCATIVPNMSVDSSCEGRRCVLAATQEGCRVELALSACLSEELVASIDDDGRLTFEPSRTLGTCVDGPARPLAEHSITCDTPHGTCTYDLYAPANRTTFEVATVSLVSSPFNTPPEQEREPLGRLDAWTGYLVDSVIVDRGLWVSTRKGTFGTIECQSPEPAELVRVDTESLALTIRRDAPPCLAQLARDPSNGGGLLGVTSGRAPTLHRFDAEGRSVEQLALPMLERIRPGDELVPTALVSGSSTTTIAIVFTTTPLSGVTWLVTVSAAGSLRWLRTAPPRAGQLRSASALVDDALFIADPDGGQVVRMPLVGQTSTLTLAPPRGASDDAGAVYWHAPTARLVVSTTSKRAALWTLDPGTGTASRAFGYEAEVVPWAITALPGSVDQGLVGLMVAPPSFQAAVGLYSLSEQRFLPGLVSLGSGVVSRLEADPRGRVWALLPWSGEVARIEP